MTDPYPSPPIKSHKLLNPPPSPFTNLTDELLIETLIHLPIKPLTLCKSLSTHFNFLISTPYFTTRYTTHHQSSFALFYQSKPTFHNLTRPALMTLRFASDSPVFHSPGFSLSFLCNLDQQNNETYNETLQYLASSNGLVLCCATLRSPVAYFVCNPLTKRFVTLPPPPSNAKTVYIGFVCNGNGNGNDVRTRFKVVRIEVVNCESVRQLSTTLKLETFCSVSGRWCEEYFMPGSGSDLERELFYGWNYRCPSAVVCGGLLHWETLSNSGVFTYDPCNGECRTIELPSEIRKPVWAFKHCLGECYGRLRYANFSWDDSCYRVWEVKDGEWWLLHKVHLDEMESTVENVNKECMGLLSLHPLNKDIVFFWCRSSCRIVEYDMGNKVLRLPRFAHDAKIISLLSPMFFPFVLPSWPTPVPPIQQHDQS